MLLSSERVLRCIITTAGLGAVDCSSAAKDSPARGTAASEFNSVSLLAFGPPISNTVFCAWMGEEVVVVVGEEEEEEEGASAVEYVEGSDIL